ncbi:bile acid:sodium symporter family protein [Xanthocytophaga agilis]|uniref:Bile acid:sodium symporter family protein n=1 Tax=Xanthocytophaga agilis TaxID=3048010 RepID=A0AAE3R964_9BACT|nr:bile acid:sodium symporter family protein [Xanthocytophaga agilis]MDJ1503785.1 bile acid:sodium symporter family protein [Xanthocytophaga agilis]
MSNSPTGFQKITAILQKAGLDGFLLALLSMIGLAYLFPYPGTKDSPFHLDEIANYGVSLIFFFYGLRLSPEKLKAGLSNWRLHTLIHFTTFILFPCLILCLQSLFKAQHGAVLWLAIFYLATLPSTVSSSVVMVSIAGGNMPAAIFNASISSLLGVFITPLWMSSFLNANSGEYHLGDVIAKLALQVLLPVVLGVLLHSRWGEFAEKNKQKLRMMDQTIILMIVYTSFCESFSEGIFHSYTLIDIFLLGVGMLALFFLVFSVVHLISKLLKFSPEDRITALFCGSKKSLVHGTVMSKVLFPDVAMAGIMLLPLMLYHALQLLVASIIAQSIARSREDKNKKAA